MATNNNEIESWLWAAADQLWANSDLRPSEYSTPVLGLIFLRYADLKFTRAKEEIEVQGATGTGRRTIGKLLLPRLIEGEVDVSDLDIPIPEGNT